MSGIVGVKVRHRLGLIDLETEHTEADLLELAGRGAKGPNNWDLSAMAVAIAASRELASANAKIDELRDMLIGLVAVAKAAGLHIDSDRLADIGRGKAKAEPPLTGPKGSDMFDKVTANLKASSPVKLVAEPAVELDGEELQRDYELRLTRAQALCRSGAGWAHVCKHAHKPRNPPQSLADGTRKPTPAELAIIEKWLDQNATRKPGSSL